MPSADALNDPCRDPLPPNLREGDHFLLHFADNRQLFAQALPRWKSAKGFRPCKINKRTYATHSLIGLSYGTVLEVGRDRLVPLPEGEDLLPGAPEGLLVDALEGGEGGGKRGDDDNNEGAGGATDTVDGLNEAHTADADIGATGNDNRNLVDNNTSQRLTHEQVHGLINDSATPGSSIVAALVAGSSTFSTKTAFSRAKYLKRKQMKHQPRCRIVRITPATLCSAMHLKDQRKISNIREDTLGRALSDANICAGQRVMVMDDAVQGLITAGCVRRMGGYGSIFSLFAGRQQPGYADNVVYRMNLSLMEKQSLKWVNLGEVFGDREEKDKQTKLLCDKNGVLRDVEKSDRELIQWPAPLQPHTRNYLLNELKGNKKVAEFLSRRSARFTRKLTRHSMLELRELVDGCRQPGEDLDDPSDSTDHVQKVEENAEEEDLGSMSTKAPRQCDSLIIATKYDPTPSLLRLLPYLAPSCPFVVYHEFLEPLLETFRTLQNYHKPRYDTCVKSENENKPTAINSSLNKDCKEMAQSSQPMMLRRNIAINLRVTDAWFREYQILEGRTHPSMTMSQNGGYILTGTKLCPIMGTNELAEDEVRHIRAKVGGRRRQQKGKAGCTGGGSKKRKSEDDTAEAQSGDRKRCK